ncbi:MAG TPA: S8 family serine peptidase, partial [Acidimicrobiales bacterium]|nr:S8 family serine peptidase [Acidimicrobiales bacterium]
AVVPQQVLTDPDDFDEAYDVLNEARQLLEDRAELVQVQEIDVAGYFAVTDVADALQALRDAGIEAQPNHLLFSASSPWIKGVRAAPVHASRGYASYDTASIAGLEECCAECPPHPGGTTGYPVHASPVHASPVHASPVHASPVHASYRGSGERSSTVAPADPPSIPPRQNPNGVTVAVLDTGLAAGRFRPLALSGPGGAGLIFGPGDVDGPDEDGNGVLDPVAGHGTFIAGVIRQVAPAVDILFRRVLNTYGLGDELHIAHVMTDLLGDALPEVVSMSFGGYGFDWKMATLARAVRRLQRRHVVLVAAAGNDATCEPTFPAALPGVIGVAATLDENAKHAAQFTNYGDWVRASTHGVDIISCFFDGFDDFHGGARWSGTSFSTPIVAGLIAGGAAPGDARPSRDAVLALAPKSWLMGVPVVSPI